MVETEVVRVTHSMRHAIAQQRFVQEQVGDECPSSGNAPGHDARDPSLPLHLVGRNPLRVLDALEEAAIDGRYAKRGCRAEEKRDHDESVGVGLER